MKTHFLGLALLCPTLTLATGQTPSDTILVKIGKKASVRFYGEKKADLKALERYDWNAIVRDMNAKLGLTTPDEPRQNYVDLFGNSYLQDSTLRRGGSVVKVTEREADKPISPKDAWRSLKSGTQVGFSIGYLRASPEYFQGNSAYKFLGSNALSISLLRNTVVRQRTHHSFSLRWGVEFSRWQLTKAEKVELNYFPLIYKNFYPELSKLPDGTKVGEISYVKTVPPYGWQSGEKILEERFDKRKLIAAYLNLPLMPTWTFYNADGKRTWRLSAGGYAGFRLGSYRKTVANDGDYKRKDYYDSGFSALRYGLALGASYRNVGLFLQYDLQGRFSRANDGRLQAIPLGFTFTTN